MKINKFTVDYESINLPNTKSRYHEIIYMYQMNPQQAYFRQNKNFKKSWEKGDPNDELDGKKHVYF